MRIGAGRPFSSADTVLWGKGLAIRDQGIHNILSETGCTWLDRIYIFILALIAKDSQYCFLSSLHVSLHLVK